MDLQKFIERMPFLYHLTSSENIEFILSEKKLYSALRLVELSNNPMNMELINQKRNDHAKIIIGEQTISVRDQRPISEKNLIKCLTNGWSCSDFYRHLNQRVFFWPTISRLERHFNRYASESPVIIQVSTKETLENNPHVKFCRLNSGATRSNSHLGGKPPERGANTFLAANEYLFNISSVAEVTFENECILGNNIRIERYPNDF